MKKRILIIGGYHKAQRLARSFLDKVYRGSVGLMVSSMVQDQALSREEIDQLYEILRQAEEGRKA